jgi:hypothetical protein
MNDAYHIMGPPMRIAAIITGRVILKVLKVLVVTNGEYPINRFRVSNTCL